MSQEEEPTLPQCEEAERSVLGAMMLDESVIAAIRCEVASEDFFDKKHQRVFQKICDLCDLGSPIDFVLLKKELRGISKEFLLDLQESCLHTGNAVYHAKAIRDKSIVRQVMALGEEAHSQGFYVNGNSREWMLSLLSRLQKSTESRVSGEIHTLDSGMTRLISSGIFDGKKKIQGITSGFLDLDEMTGGFSPGELTIVAGRPSMGKSAFVLSLLGHMSYRENVPTMLFSLEMGEESIWQRVLCMASGANLLTMRRGLLTEGERERVFAANERLTGKPLYVCDEPALSAVRLRAMARMACERYGIKVLGIDYLQLLRGSTKDGRTQEITEISGTLKAIARENKVSVIALSQLNRQADLREDKRPKLSDLRESGSIEQDADLVLLLYRDGYYRPEEDSGMCEVEIAKQRNGPTGRVTLHFAKESGIFSSPR